MRPEGPARELLRESGALTPADTKSYRLHRFSVPNGVGELRISFTYDRGGEYPHSLVTLSLFDASGFRGAAHRFAPRQSIHIKSGEATPGFLPGPITAGEWTLELDLHSVIASGRYSLAVEAALGRDPAIPEAIKARLRAPGGRRWLRGELHLHSTHSDGRWTPGEMADAARGRNLDFLFLTDHNTVSGVEELGRAVGDTALVLPGQELTTFHGHALALGPSRWLDWRIGLGRRTINDLARDVGAAGGVFVVAHPDAPPDDVCTGCRWTYADFDPTLAHAVEVWGGLWDGPEERNQGCLALWRQWLNAGHRLTATGATDAHRHQDWEGPVPLTYVLADNLSLPAIVDGLREGRTCVSSGPELHIRVRGADGTEATVGGTAPVPGTIEASCAASPAAELRLVAGGETRARAQVKGEGRVTAEAQPGDRWFCAELWQGQTLLAVTSPVYMRPASIQ